MLYQLLFNTHYFLLHTSYIFIFLYFYIILYVYLYIFYGFLTVPYTVYLRFTLQFSLQFTLPYGFVLLQFPPSYSCLPYGRLRTVPSTVFSTSFYTVISIRFSLSSLTILICSTILFSYSL